ncbi:MAG: tRNA (adenosine(37)-N6)-threonylcarbamoyltransferase complex dimerization subunit type 1 TsaB [bacterium]
MCSLIIDTSTKYLYLCLVKDNKVIKEILEDGNKNHAPHSVLLIEEILKNNKININELTEVICGIGPGSYTGLRISLTIAKMICSFKNIPLKTISTLYLMSSAYEGKIVPVISARRENYFCGGYNNDKLILEENVRTKEEIEQEVKEFKYIEEDMFKVDPLKVLKYAKEESKVDEVVPNYLRITEAEYNLKNKNDKKM